MHCRALLSERLRRHQPARHDRRSDRVQRRAAAVRDARHRRRRAADVAFHGRHRRVRARRHRAADARRLRARLRRRAGAAAVLLPDISAAGLVAYVDELVARVAHERLALYLYHIPQNTGVPWPVEVVAELKAKPSARAGRPEGQRRRPRLRARGRQGVADFDVFPSSEAALGNASADGFAGCISATTNLTARYAQAAWSGAGHRRRRGGRAEGRRPARARRPQDTRSSRAVKSALAAALRRRRLGARLPAAGAARRRATARRPRLAPRSFPAPQPLQRRHAAR